jgi:AcrR family transcriptional regulator
MTDVVTPRRGRPPKLSREKIVGNVAEMLLADPGVPLTIARVAEAIGTAPMSLYRHFADREDLVVAVAHHLFIEARPPVAPDASWQDQIRTWMVHVYAQSTRVPQLVQLIAKGESPAWVADSAYLAAIFTDAGFGDDRRVAEAVYWVATTTMGHAMIRATGPREFPIEALHTAVGDLDANDAAHMARVLPHLAAIHDEGFAVAVEWTIAGLEAMLAAR